VGAVGGEDAEVGAEEDGDAGAEGFGGAFGGLGEAVVDELGGEESGGVGGAEFFHEGDGGVIEGAVFDGVGAGFDDHVEECGGADYVDGDFSVELVGSVDDGFDLGLGFEHFDFGVFGGSRGLAEFDDVGAAVDFFADALRVGRVMPDGQEFFCVGPYSIPECATQAALLQAVLRNYDADRLGKWSWVVVRSEDWKRLASRLHLDPASPAFSHLGNRQTFFDEALLVLKPKRETELIAKWKIPFDQFLDFAVRHELGHAFCQEADEVKAERYGQRLRKSGPISCEAKKQHNLLAEVR
jgi:hypothetical protein